jgi:hypothetical protein
MKLLTPPNYVNIDKPVLFLAGPIQGAQGWQDDAIKIINKADLDIYIANPRRRERFEESYSNRTGQYDWETYHLTKAGLPEDEKMKGVVMFWLAKEHEHICGLDYAKTTRNEIGKWSIYHKLLGANIVVGIEEGFSGKRYLEHTLPRECQVDKIYHTLEETCDEAIRLIKR